MKRSGRALLSVREGDKKRIVALAAKLLELGFELDVALLVDWIRLHCLSYSYKATAD